MQTLSRFNHGVNFVLVAVATLSLFVWAIPLKKRTTADCRNALQKILKALHLRNDSQTAMMEPKFCQTKWICNQIRQVRLKTRQQAWIKQKSEKSVKTWEKRDRQRSSAYLPFFHNVSKNGINVYSTHSGSEPVFAERNIRSLKALFIVLDVNKTDTDFENLQHIINFISIRVNFTGRCA